MSHRLSRLASRRRIVLEALLGGECWACGSTSPLHFDHPSGRDYAPSSLSSHQRMKRYERDAAQGELRLLCASCNDSRAYNNVYLEPPENAALALVPLAESVRYAQPADPNIPF